MTLGLGAVAVLCAVIGFLVGMLVRPTTDPIDISTVPKKANLYRRLDDICEGMPKDEIVEGISLEELKEISQHEIESIKVIHELLGKDKGDAQEILTTVGDLKKHDAAIREQARKEGCPYWDREKNLYPDDPENHCTCRFSEIRKRAEESEQHKITDFFSSGEV